MWKKKHHPGSPTPATPKMRPMELAPTPSPAPASFFDRLRFGTPKRSFSRSASPTCSLLTSPTLVSSPTIVAPTPRLPPGKIIIPSTPKSAPSPAIHAPTPRLATPVKNVLNTPMPPTPAPVYRSPAAAYTMPRPSSRHHRRHESEDASFSDVETRRAHRLRRRTSPGRRPSSTMPDRQPSMAVPTPTPRERRVSLDQVPVDLSTIALHWQLLPWLPQQSKPRLEFDIVNPPTGILIRSNPTLPPRPVRQDDLAKPAIKASAMTRMVIVVEAQPQWPISVRPRGSGGGFCCEDVFQAIHETFQVPLTPEEQEDIARDHARHEACQRAFRLRCKRSMRLTEYEARKGLRRVDVFGERTWFDGLLQPVDTTKGYWILSLRRPATP